MTKIIVNAKGVKALLDIEPETVAELAKNASSQVAEEIIRKVKSEKFDRAIDEEMEKALKRLSYERIVPDYAKTLMLTTATEVVRKALEAVSEEIAKAALQKAVQTAISHVEETLNSRIEGIVVAKMRALMRL
jgi:histone H3/H4